jgi:hypothetical protein
MLVASGADVLPVGTIVIVNKITCEYEFAYLYISVFIANS